MRRLIGSTRIARTFVTFAMLALCASRAHAQSLWQRLDLDRLRLEGIGAVAGPVTPANVVSTSSYGVEGDYGEIAPHLRVGFSGSYWSSHFTDKTVNGFITQLEKSLDNPNDSIKFDRVKVSAISVEVDLRYTPTNVRAAVQPYIGGALGIHIVNAESKLIKGTFVESALDNIGAGITGIAGIGILPTHRVSALAEARYTLLGSQRFGTVRAGAMFHFGRQKTTRVSTP